MYIHVRSSQGNLKKKKKKKKNCIDLGRENNVRPHGLTHLENFFFFFFFLSPLKILPMYM